MSKVTLPRLNQSGPNEWADVEANDVALREVVNGGIDNENIKASAGIEASKLAAAAKPVTWYTPKIIATEESRTNVAYGTLPTADEIPGILVPENGKLVIAYRAHVKNSVANAGRVAIFIGPNQLKGTDGSVAETSGVESTAFRSVYTLSTTLTVTTTETADASTGQVLAGELPVFVAAGTYTVSVQYKASSGSITAKERKLWAEVHGV